jgi:hypothetical protein
MSIGKIVTITVLLMIAMVGLKFVSSWYDHLRLQETMREAVAQAQVLTDEAVISSVLVKAKDLQVPLDQRHIHLERGWYGGTRLWAEYHVTLTFPLGFSHTQRFRPDVRSGR